VIFLPFSELDDERAVSAELNAGRGRSNVPALPNRYVTALDEIEHIPG
jgi:hypothetical protein